jgi:PAS domain S-box-containing protein
MYTDRQFFIPGVPVRRVVLLICSGLILCGLYLISRANYLLFHGLIEVFSIAVACSIFLLFWNSRQFLDDGYYLFLGIASLFVGGVDLLHTLAYKGMGVFPGYDANLPTQLWIAARYIQSLSFVIAPLFLRRRLRPVPVLVAYALILCLLLGSIFYWGIFPDCYIEGTGLTPFKKASEYIISLILVVSIGLLSYKRRALDPDVFRLLVVSTVVTIASELAFTFYISVYGLSNLIGHLLKVVAFYLIYRAFIEVGLTKPYALLFRNLKESERSLRESEERFRALVQNSSDLISVFDPDGRVRYQSPALEQMFGYCEEDIVGRNALELVHPDDLPSAMEALADVLEEPGRTGSAELRYRHNGGSWHWVEVTCANLLENPAVAGLVANSRDITKRKHAEETIKTALREKEVLLQEIHHRVKNNLQLISSLLDLQSKATEDSPALRVLRESRNHVRSMALVHERLYESQDLTEIDLDNLVHGLTSHLFRIYAPRAGEVFLNVQIGSLLLDVAAAIPCALIINELVSNSLKYAFPSERDRSEGERNEIRVEMRQEADARTVLVVGDNGIGLPPDLDWQDPPSLGLQLVKMLAEQLDGTIELDRSSGILFEITFAHRA